VLTERLYYQDCYLREFQARVGETADNGLRVYLDRTAFYPTSGGQPFDTGTLGSFAVVDVVDDEDGGEILHLIGAGTSHAEGAGGPAVGDRLHGTVDWLRRFDHMQQHTGQHVLSAAFDRLFKVRTVSFHMGLSSSTIDLAREVTAKELAAAEDAANRIVWEDRPVSIRYATAAEAAQLPLRKESARGGTLRLIDVQDFDLSACGGTHVARTGAIGVIAAATSERFKGGSRIEFVCGGRALDRFRSLRETVAAATRLLSAGAPEVPSSIERLQAEVKEHKRAMAGVQIELARLRADELAATAEPVHLRAQTADGKTQSTTRLVACAIDADASGLKALASAVAAKPGFVLALISAGRPSLVVVARSADVAVNANEVLAGLISKFGGRGGGRPELAQGGGLDAAADVIIAQVHAVLTAQP
jgi:alanyl-tRNA synthetase